MLDCLADLRHALEKRGVELLVIEGDPVKILPRLMSKTGAAVVTWASGSTPFARRRDQGVSRAILDAGGQAIEVQDHHVFGPDEIKTKLGGNYSIYTPYRNEWWKTWESRPRLSRSRARLPAAYGGDVVSMDGRTDLGIRETHRGGVMPVGGEAAAKRRLRGFLRGPAWRYHVDRDRPDVDGTSRLSPYIRFGAISVRRCFTDALREMGENLQAREGISKWLDELIWRDFYNSVLVHSPHVLSGSFRPEYDQLHWSGSDSDFEAWCEGKTGYPFVDAGMRQLKASGWMHNRSRMVVACFLTKDLLIDWRRGERFFFESLVDGDPASNNGGWQWSASTGTDAQPYFRIFNPVTQSKKCDPEGHYIRKWIPELRDLDAKSIHAPWEHQGAPTNYPRPIVDHSIQRHRAIEEFKRVRAISG